MAPRLLHTRLLLPATLDRQVAAVLRTLLLLLPTQGVLRFIPFALNASVGDTVMFMWGANNHTVTKSSELTPCNKTADAPFSSGEQNLGFVCSSFLPSGIFV